MILIQLFVKYYVANSPITFTSNTSIIYQLIINLKYMYRYDWQHVFIKGKFAFCQDYKQYFKD